MTSRRRKVGIGVGLGLASLCVAGWALVTPRVQDHFEFLGDRRPSFVGVIGPGSWPATESRTYSWKEPWQDVAARAEIEMKSLGMTPFNKGKVTGALWRSEVTEGGLCGNGSGMSVHIRKGKAVPLTQWGDFADNDSEWVTVGVVSDLDDSWANVIRYTCFPIREK